MSRAYPKRKTIEVAEIVAKANQVFRDSGNEFKTGRAATKLLVEDILMKTGNYKGFNYLTESEVEPGKSFGIEWSNQPKPEPKFHDQTRIKFYA
jgi:hypothetical protein